MKAYSNANPATYRQIGRELRSRTKKGGRQSTASSPASSSYISLGAWWVGDDGDDFVVKYNGTTLFEV